MQATKALKLRFRRYLFHTNSVHSAVKTSASLGGENGGEVGEGVAEWVQHITA